MPKSDIDGTALAEAEPKLIGGNLSFDYANSSYSWEESYFKLVEWSAKVEVIDEAEANRLINTAKALPTEADQILEQALKLRELIYNLFSAVATHKPVAAEDLAVLNHNLKEVKEHIELVESSDGFEWAWKKGGDGPNLDQVLWPIIRSAGDLLTNKELGRVKECPGQDCGRLFLDLSRNRSRRWCDMDHCGMLVKSRKHYAKIRQTKLAL